MAAKKKAATVKVKSQEFEIENAVLAFTIDYEVDLENFDTEEFENALDELRSYGSVRVTKRSIKGVPRKLS